MATAETPLNLTHGSCVSAEAVDNGHGPGCFEALVKEGGVKILMGVTRICYIVSWPPDFLDLAADLEYSFVIDRPTGAGFIFSCQDALPLLF